MKRAVAASVMVFGLFACGGSGTHAVSAGASAALRADDQQIRSAAATGDVATATAKLAKLRTRVATFRTQGQITDDGVQRVLAAANEVEQQLHLVSPTTTTETTVPPDPTKDHGKGNGGDNGD